MSRSPTSVPRAIVNLVDGAVAAARAHGLHGGVRVEERDDSYEIIIRVPKKSESKPAVKKA